MSVLLAGVARQPFLSVILPNLSVSFCLSVCLSLSIHRFSPLQTAAASLWVYVIIHQRIVCVCVTNVSPRYSLSSSDAVMLCACLDAQQLLAICENCLAEQRKILHQRNILCAKVLDRAFDACIDIGNWQQAVKHGIQLAELLRYNILLSSARC